MNPFLTMSNNHKNIVDLFIRKPTVTVTQCPKVAAIILCQDNNVTLQFCVKCVHATIGMTCCTVKYSHCKTKDDATLLAVQDCIDKFNLMSKRHDH